MMRRPLGSAPLAAVRARAVPPPRAAASRLFSSAATGVTSMLTAALKPLGAGYLITCAIVFLAQRKLQYMPEARRPSHPAAIHPAFSEVIEVEFVAEDGTRCLGWHWPAPAADAPPQPPFWLPGERSKQRVSAVVQELRHDREALRQMDLLLFHGNAGDRSSRLAWMHLVREGLGCSVTVLDYRGYGGSEGSPTEQGLLQDGAAATQWLRRRQQEATGPPRRLVLWGESIGSGVAVALAAERGAGEQPAAAPDAIVIEGGFSSCVDIGAQAYPWIPVRLFMKDKFETAARAARLPKGLPVLMVHGAKDDIAPIELGRKLYAALPVEGRQFVELENAGHNDIPYQDSARYLKAVGAFLSERARRAD